jgi:Xaa-Pro dipeptidase
VVGFGGTDFLDQDQAPKLLAACLRIAATARIGIAGFDARVGTATPIDDLVREIRLRKDAEEIDAIADAQRLALRAQAEVARLVTEGAREIELCSAAASAAQDAAGKPVDVITVLASGPRTAGAAPPVLVPSKRAMGPGDAVLADLAVRHDGYWGDTTRTYVCGRSDEIEEARATLSDIARGIAESLRPGLRAREVFEHAQAAIREHFPGQDLIHHAGHGIGLEVGESPQLVPAEDMPLQEGMVLAIEPGLYVSGRYGVRVEDVYVVAPSGSVLVTAHDDER